MDVLTVEYSACVSGYFNNDAPHINEDEPEEDPVCLGYKAILDSKSTDETLVGFFMIGACTAQTTLQIHWFLN